jgi:DNA-binding MarR family transcriptional regulator
LTLSSIFYFWIMIKKAQAVAAVREFNRFYTNIIGVVNRHVYESPYSLSEVRIMYEINHTPVCTASDIKRTLQIDEGYLSRIIDKFVKQKLVKKMQSPKDGRVYMLKLTPKGNALFNKLNEASEHSVEALVEKLSGHELQELINMMEGVRRILSK